MKCGKWSGKNHPLYGKPRPKEIKDKISKTLMGDTHAQRGKSMPKEQKRKISEAQRGEKGHNWKGGITPYRIALWHSQEFKNWRKSIFERDNYTCQLCGKRINTYIQAHHILSFTDYPDLRFEVDNGITHCQECHYILHGIEKIGDQFQPLPKI